MASDRSANASGLVRSGYVPVMIYAPIVLAQARGYYADAGVEVELRAMPTGRDIVPNLVSGRFDIAAGGPGPDFWQALRDGHDIRLIAPLHAERPPATTPLIARADLFDSGEVASVEDLRGRPVSSPSPGVPLFWLHSALERGGLTLDDVDLRFVPYDQVGAAFQRREIDAALLGEPLVTDLIDRGIAARLESDFVDGLQPTYLYTLAETLETRRDEITRFVSAYLRACADLQSGNLDLGWSAASTMDVISHFTDVPGVEVAESMHPIYEPEGRFRRGSIARIYDFFVARGDVEPIDGFDPDSLIDESIVEALRDGSHPPTSSPNPGREGARGESQHERGSSDASIGQPSPRIGREEGGEGRP
ncbi:MAG TPA: ABC transporter substrate-binding protein [Thermomicrobiales bacterium]|nr:ABC transporter substrate-binding protein [Thermomicrobiales bacterium]